MTGGRGINDSGAMYRGERRDCVDRAAGRTPTWKAEGSVTRADDMWIGVMRAYRHRDDAKAGDSGGVL